MALTSSCSFSLNALNSDVLWSRPLPVEHGFISVKPRACCRPVLVGWNDQFFAVETFWRHFGPLSFVFTIRFGIRCREIRRFPMFIQHPDPTVAHVLTTWAPRMFVQGIDYNDFITTSTRIRAWDDWCREWCATAAGHEVFARENEAKGNRESATEAYLLA